MNTNLATLIRVGNGPFDNGTEYWRINGVTYWASSTAARGVRCADGSPVEKHRLGGAPRAASIIPERY